MKAFSQLKKGRDAPRGWFEDEPLLKKQALANASRVLHRGRISWRLWLPIALVLASARAAWTYKVPEVFDVTAVLRVSEGKVPVSSARLGAGVLRPYLEDLALTRARLLQLMQRHAKSFPSLATDPTWAVQTLRELIDIQIAENDFNEERGSDEPPRALRLAITFSSSDPELAWTVTQELVELVGGSALEGQKAALEKASVVATAAVRRAEDELNAILAEKDTSATHEIRVTAARRQLFDQQQRMSLASLANRGFAERQVLRFDVVDRGQMPVPMHRLRGAVQGFVSTLLLVIVAGWLLAGAFDSRILDGKDLEALGLVVFGRLPKLPARPSVRSGTASEPSRPRV